MRARASTLAPPRSKSAAILPARRFLALLASAGDLARHRRAINPNNPPILAKSQESRAIAGTAPRISAKCVPIVENRPKRPGNRRVAVRHGTARLKCGNRLFSLVSTNAPGSMARRSQGLASDRQRTGRADIRRPVLFDRRYLALDCRARQRDIFGDQGQTIFPPLISRPGTSKIDRRARA